MWGENCGEKTNCLLYDTHAMRTNISAFVACFMFIGLLFESLVWYYVKDLKIFDDEKGQLVNGGPYLLYSNNT